MYLAKHLALATILIAFSTEYVPGDVVTTGNVDPDPVTANSTTYLKIGDTADGTMTVDSNGGDHDVVSGTNMIGYTTPGVTGAVSVVGAGASWTCDGALHVGWEGNGALGIKNGGSVSSDAGSIGVKSGSVSSVTVEGVDSQWTMSTTFQTFSVGSQGNGTLHVKNGGAFSNNVGMIIGDYASGTGSVIVENDGSTLTTSGSLYVGRYGKGSLEINNGGAVSTGLTRIGYGSTSTGSITVEGAGSKWTTTKLYLGYQAPGSLNILNGGKVKVEGDVSNRYGSEITIGISNDNMFTIDGDLRNETAISLMAGKNLASGAYTPIAVTGSWTGSGLYKAVGGTWNPTTHVFTVSDARQAAAGETTQIVLPLTQRLAVGNNLGVSFASGTETIHFTAAVTSLETKDLLLSLLDGDESILGSWDFTTDLAPGNETLLSYLVPLGAADLQIWHYDSVNGWTEHFVDNVSFHDGWVSFPVNSFSSYAVTGMAIPEPSSLLLLGMGSMILLHGRRKR